MKAYIWKRLGRVKCARGSIRTKRIAKGKVLRLCCPRGPGHWKRGRCSVGTRAVEIGVPR